MKVFRTAKWKHSFEAVLSKYQFRFRKGFSVFSTLDQGGNFGAILTYHLKAIRPLVS